MSTNYILKSDYREKCKKFEKDNNLSNCIMYEGDKSSEHVNSGVHFNAAVTYNFDKYDINKIKHIDMEKAYFNFKKCPLYDGFLQKPGPFQVCEIPLNDAMTTPGYYTIDELNWKGVHENTRKIIKKLKIYFNKLTFPHFELKMLHNLGLKFKIIAGTSGVKCDLNFGADMLTKENGVRHYARWTGIQYKKDKYTTFDFDNTDKKILQNMNHTLNQVKCGTLLHENYHSKKITMSYEKSEIKHRSHIVGYITGYQRVSTILQLCEINYNDLVKVVVDGIYYQDSGKYENLKMISSFIPDETKFADKANLGNVDFSDFPFISNTDRVTLPIRIDDYIKFSEVTLIAGAGGCGKTYSVLNNPSYYNITYLAHSHRLARAVEKEYTNLNHSAPFQPFYSKNTELSRMVVNRCNLILCDEVSTYSFKNITTLIELAKIYGIQIIFAGDIGYQTEPVECPSTPQKRLKLFKNIIYMTKNYRFTDKVHRKCVYKIRKMMDQKKSLLKMLMYLKKNKYKFINKDYVKKNHKLEDMILSSRHIFNDEWNTILPKYEKKKCLVTETNMTHSHGEILFCDKVPKNARETYGFTIHAVQGMTSQKKLFIDTRKLIDTKIFYTAISRAKSMDQIYFIV